MTYCLDLDEIPLDKLTEEIGRRCRCRIEGRCDYCGRFVDAEPCKFPDRHRESAETKIAFDAAVKKPVPPVKVFRPWTADELWEHRDCWFREKRYEEMPARIMELNLSGGVAHMESEDYDVTALRDNFEYLDPATNEWLPCGVWTEQAAE